MVNLELNTKKSQRKSKRKSTIKPYPVRPTREVACYLKGVYNKSKFINKAISFYILLLTNPEPILKELKRRDPKLYKYIGRKKFL